MSAWEPDFLDEMRRLFAVEAEEYVQTIASGLVAIEKEQDPAKRQIVIEAIYRAAHSLKGASRSVNLPGVGAVCQSMESVFSAMKRNELNAGRSDFDVLQRAIDAITQMLASGAETHDAEAACVIAELERIAALGKAPPAATDESQWPKESVDADVLPTFDAQDATAAMPVAGKAAVAPCKTPDTIRIATAKLDSILLQAEELISVKLMAQQRIAELAESLELLSGWIKEWERAATRRTALSGFDSSSLPELSSRSLARMHELESHLGVLWASLQSDHRSMGMLVDQLLEDAKRVLMVPFSSLLQTFPKMVRDISRQQHKEVSLLVTGAEIEIDKRILERMKDPLIHLVRNSIDHGLEKPNVRTAQNKTPGGTIAVDVSQAEGNRIQILVSDDGAGIDAAKLREVAVKRGLLAKEEADALDDHAALMLVFHSGLSTSPLITDISGRGLGMAIVQEAVDKLGGRITLDTKKGEGTTFRISLPLTLATFHGTLVQECGRLFAIPTSSVDRAIRVRREDVRTVENRETITVNGMPLAMVRLGAVLGIPPDGAEPQDRSVFSVVVLTAGRQRMAFLVDGLLCEQEILTKGLGKQLVRVRNLTGATVLGSGKVVPVLNVADLLKSAVHVGRTAIVSHAAKAATQRKSILLAEDSITSRVLLKNILAADGFDVHTVVDGAEAWNALQSRRFDAVVSDVEMPRVDGFELTAKIRGDAEFAELPVVLVTSLESRSDRERGIEVGADAYIMKSSFDQSNLLAVVRQLI